MISTNGLFSSLLLSPAYFCEFRNCFGSESGFLRQLFFFFNPRNGSDMIVLVETCRVLLHLTQNTGNFGLYILEALLAHCLFKNLRLLNQAGK